METQELEHTGTSAGENDNSNSGELTITTEKVFNTPFLLRWEKDKGYSFGIINYRLSDYYETKKEVEERIHRMEWNDISGMIAAIVDATLKMNNLIK